MAVFPDELIKIFLFLTIFVIALNSFVNGFAKVHPEIKELTGFRTMNDIPACDFSENSLNQEIFNYPISYTESDIQFPDFWNVETDEIDFWADSGSYPLVNIEADSNLDVGRDGSEYLHLSDSAETGQYTIDFNLDPRDSELSSVPDDYSGTILNTIDGYVDVGEDQNIGVDVRVLSDVGEEDYNVSYQNNYVLDNSSKIRYILDLDGYEISDTDKWLRITINFDETGNTDYVARFNELSVYGERVETYGINDRLECSVLVVQEWGKSLFIDTGITVLDGVFTVLGSFMFIISVILSGLLIILGLIVSAFTVFI